MKFTKISLLSFFKHFINIAWAMHHTGKRIYRFGTIRNTHDVVEMSDGSTERLKVRSLVESYSNVCRRNYACRSIQRAKG
jgi:hypothetical protein